MGGMESELSLTKLVTQTTCTYTGPYCSNLTTTKVQKKVHGCPWERAFAIGTAKNQP
jgi:hypothetical protein